MNIIKTVHYPGLDSTSIDESSLHWLIRLLEFTAPRFVIEAGTYMGHFAIVAAGVLHNQRRGGKVWTFDPQDYGSRTWIEQNKLDNVDYVQAGFEELPVRYPWLMGMVDLAFVDSGPHGEAPEGFNKAMRFEHYELAKTMVRPHGLVIVDDLMGEWEHVETIREECVILEGGRGIGLWQKR